MKEEIYKLKINTSLFNDVMQYDAPLILNLKKENMVSIYKIELLETIDGVVRGREISLRILEKK